MISGGVKGWKPVPYSAKFKKKMLEKMMGPGARSANSLSKEVGVSQSALSEWLRKAKMGVMPKDDGEGRRAREQGGRQKRWSPAEKIRVVKDATAAGEAGLGALLRREGLHEADLERFREEVLEAAARGFDAGRRRRGLSLQEKELRALRKELTRKEKALAEAAALLVLRGKVQAFLSGEEEGGTDGSNER
jgi:transposase